MSILNSGPAIEPATPISPYPSLATAQLSPRSGAEFPRLRSVIARKISDTLSNTPRVEMMSTRNSAMNHTHSIDIPKEKRASGTFQVGSRFLYVNLQSETEISSRIKAMATIING